MYKAIICRIQTEEIPGAENLQKANCAGYTALIGKEHSNGELGIFFPYDGQLSKRMTKENRLHRDDGGYLENNRRIRTIKLMKIPSEGLWLPISSLNWTLTAEKSKRIKTDETNLNKKLRDLEEGDLLTHLNGVHICNKYVTPATRNKTQRKLSLKEKIRNWYRLFLRKHTRNNFPKHFDTENVRHLLAKNTIPTGTPYYVTIKLHGTSARSGFVRATGILRSNLEKIGILKPKYISVVGTRNLILPHRSCNDEYRFTAHNLLKNKIQKDEIIYYEIVGYGENGSIMASHSIKDKSIVKKYSNPMFYSYGMKSVKQGEKAKYGENFDIYIYRITQNGKDLNPEELKTRVQELGFKIVPQIHTGVWNDDTNEFLNKCAKLAEGPSLFDPSHIEEGVCIRFYSEEIDLTVKYKSWLFCDCEGIAKNSETYIDPEEIDEE